MEFVDWVLVEAREVGGEECSFLSAALLRSDGAIILAEDGGDVGGDSVINH